MSSASPSQVYGTGIRNLSCSILYLLYLFWDPGLARETCRFHNAKHWCLLNILFSAVWVRVRCRRGTPLPTLARHQVRVLGDTRVCDYGL